MRTCSKCKVRKDFSSFYKRSVKSKGTYSSWCRECENKRSRERYQMNRDHNIARECDRYNQLTKEERLKRNKNTDLKRRYGITLDEYEEMLRRQNGVCAICSGGTLLRNRNFIYHVDHDHATGKVRGLLCTSCNLGLGAFKDNIDQLMSAATYLIQQENILEWVTSED